MMAMMSQIEVGNRLIFTTLTGNVTVQYQVIGILDQSVLQGAVMSRANVLEDFGMEGMVSSLFMVDVDESHDVAVTAELLEKDFAAIGMNARMFRELAEDSMKMMNSMFILFELYLYMGLVVGVAGLGIITIRSVVERTPEIGILRSIGFKRKNVRNAFLIEILFVATMGVLIGTFAGIVVSYEIFNVMVSGLGDNIEYLVPWGRIALVTVVAYIATIICTIIPAHNASKISPAEALRYVG
jgi:putative ABC transport system permease protein